MRTIDEALKPYTDEHCSICGGVLIGSELDYGTCGHCGGRSLRPDGGKTAGPTRRKFRWSTSK